MPAVLSEVILGFQRNNMLIAKVLDKISVTSEKTFGLAVEKRDREVAKDATAWPTEVKIPITDWDDPFTMQVPVYPSGRSKAIRGRDAVLRFAKDIGHAHISASFSMLTDALSSPNSYVDCRDAHQAYSMAVYVMVAVELHKLDSDFEDLPMLIGLWTRMIAHDEEDLCASATTDPNCFKQAGEQVRKTALTKSLSASAPGKKRQREAHRDSHARTKDQKEVCFANNWCFNCLNVGTGCWDKSRKCTKAWVKWV
eukprot:GILJ01021020.1.p1 GENE.GILJ01021020.1~~GILJ01021020.1.p1  ORF type:complete len:254 (+),score=17.91 GILJ01021020.1:341-1102(+)